VITTNTCSSVPGCFGKAGMVDRHVALAIEQAATIIGGCFRIGPDYTGRSRRTSRHQHNDASRRCRHRHRHRYR
jgi:hypothetical protein